MKRFLDEAFAEAQLRLARWRREDLLGALLSKLAPRASRGGFAAALRNGAPISVIAELKRASPLSGPLVGEIDVGARARLYAEAGAAAVSVVTETRWFGGSLGDFLAARRCTEVPLLRKDFIVDEYDLEISAAVGADAVLLIAARFDVDRLRDMVAFAGQIGLDALVETHDEHDAAVACEAGAEIIGVNSRDLRTLSIDLNGAFRVLRELPADRLKVLESGLRSPHDVQTACASGARAVLIGEVLMRANDPAATIRSLLGRQEATKQMAQGAEPLT